MSVAALATDPGPFESLKNFSDFQQLDLNRLAGDEIFSERGSLMDFPNGISAQTCFMVPLSAEETAKQLQLWDPSPHAELKVFAFHALHAPCELTDFQPLDFKASQKPVRWLMDKTVASTPGKSDLNLSHEEAQTLAGCVQKRADPQKVSECWAKLLLDRATAFQQKGSMEPSPMRWERVRVAGHPATHHAARTTWHCQEFADPEKNRNEENKAVHHSRHSITGQFSTPTIMGPSRWGRCIKLAVGDHFQLVDMEYYVNANYYTSATLFEVWPIKIGEKSESLVWRGDFFAAPMLAFTKGTERIAYGALMLQRHQERDPLLSR